MIGKKQLIWFALSISAALASTGVRAQSPEAAVDYAEYGVFLDEFRKSQSIRAMTAVIVRDQEIVWEAAFGTSDDEGEIPTTIDTTFNIASVTKPIAAAAILKEAATGGLTLDVPLASDSGWDAFCKWFSGSGIIFGSGGTDQDGSDIQPVDCERDFRLRDILNMQVNGKQADRFVYNPMAFARIDRAIEGAGGRPLRAIVRDNILTPAAMENVALGWHDPDGGSALRLLAPPFAVQEDGRTKKTSLGDDDFRAAAGIKASVRHLAKFDIALDKGALLPDRWMKRIFTEQAISPEGAYRWGWFVQDWNDNRLFWHSGWDPDRYSAIYLKLPKYRLTLIVLANGEGLWWDNSLARAEIQKSPVVARFLEQFVKR